MLYGVNEKNESGHQFVWVATIRAILIFNFALRAGTICFSRWSDLFRLFSCYWNFYCTCARFWFSFCYPGCKCWHCFFVNHFFFFLYWHFALFQNKNANNAGYLKMLRTIWDITASSWIPGRHRFSVCRQFNAQQHGMGPSSLICSK